MTTDRETARIVRSWLQLGVDQLPDRVLDAVLDELPSIPQRRSPWSAWRFLQMPNLIKLTAAAVAVLVVAVVGFQLLPTSSLLGGPTSTPAPTATLAPLPTTTPAPSSSPPVIAMGTRDAQLTPGTYRVADPFRPYTVSFPSSWSVADAERSGVVLYRTEPADFAPTVIIDRIHELFADPCHPPLASAPPSTSLPTGQEIVAGLTSMKDFTAGPVSDVIVGGHPAKTFVLTNAITDEAAAKCGGSPLDIWNGGLGRNTTNQRSRDHIWVVDVNGTPVTIDASSVPGRTPADLITEADAVVSSIQFDD